MKPALILLPLMAALSLGLAGCQKPKAKTTEAQLARAVRVVQIQPQPITGALAASGDLMPREEAAVYAEVAGYRVARVLSHTAINGRVVIEADVPRRFIERLTTPGHDEGEHA